MRRALPADELLECRLQGINVEDWPTFYEKQTGKILVTNLRPSWLIFSDGFVKTDTTQMVKRAMDVALALTGLVLSLPAHGDRGLCHQARLERTRSCSGSSGSASGAVSSSSRSSARCPSTPSATDRCGRRLATPG